MISCFSQIRQKRSLEFGVWSLEFGVKDCSIEVYDLNGRKLLEKCLPAGKETTEFDVSGLQNGVYFIHLQFENQMMTKKLIIQH